MSFEDFQIGALNLGYTLEIDKHGGYRYGHEGVGVAYFQNKYIPFGCALCKYFTDDVFINRLRNQLVLDGTAEIAYDYLELLSTLERTPNGAYTD